MSTPRSKNPLQYAAAVLNWDDAKAATLAGSGVRSTADGRENSTVAQDDHQHDPQDGEGHASGEARSDSAGLDSSGAGENDRAKRVGIREVAKAAGVSVATVSMVLNSNPKITEATRRRVSRVVADLGYQPNRLAQSLSGQYTRLLAVLMPTLRHAVADPYFGELISGICDRAAKRGHKVMLEHAKPEFVRQAGHTELLTRRYVDGVLCLGFNDRHEFLRDYAGREFPVMAVNNVFPEWGLDHVVCDYQSGTEQAMTYLSQLGHRRIAMIHGAPETQTVRTVMQTFADRLAAMGGEVTDACFADGRFTEEGGAEACRQLLERCPDLTAVFAGNDKMALGAVHHLTRSGRHVPRDVSVIGFDDIQYSAFTTPTLSTVHTPLYELGVRAADRLIELVRGKTTGVADILPTHLVLRESTSIAPDAGR